MDPSVRAVVVALVLTLAGGACSDKSGGASKASPTTASSGATSSPTSVTPQTGPVTDADFADVDQVLRRLDTELDRLDSDMAASEGETQQVLLQDKKRLASAATTRRILALREMTTAAKAIARLSDADRTELTNQLQQQVNGLTSLNAKIQGDNDEASLRADAQKVITEYRVYVLTIPKSRGVVVSDIELNAADRLSKLADRLASAIAQAKEGKDTTKAQTDLASLRAKVAAVVATVTPLPAALLALQPAGYPGNHPTLEQARQSLRTGRAGLAEAAQFARQVIADLK
jgi:hypothetical protein